MAITELNGNQIRSVSVPVGDINATGTPSSTTYLRGDGTWSPVTSSITRLISSVDVNTTGGSTILTDYVYKATAGLVFTLPTAVGNTNKYTLKATTIGVSFATTSAQTVDGSTTGTLITNQSLTFYSDGSNWLIS